MILMNNFKAEPEELLQNELAAVEGVLRSGWYVLGDEVKKFEARWAAYCQLPHAIGVGNGMDAIEIGLRAVDIGPGDEVITTAMTAFATILAVLRAGATPVLADIDPDTGLLSIDSVKRCLSSRTKAVLLVHLYGHIHLMNEWEALCRNADIALLEDCAQAHGARWDDKVAGSFGIWGAYSFYPTKNLGARGDGGALVTGSAKIAERARVLRNYGQSERYSHSVLGLNSRLDELHAAMLAIRLTWLDRFTLRRREIADVYQRRINNKNVCLLTKPVTDCNHTHHLFVILSKERDRLARYLKAAEIDSLSHYPIPIHRQTPCVNIARDPGGLPHAERHATECLSIPCHPQMNNADVEKVVETLNAFN